MVRLCNLVLAEAIRSAATEVRLSSAPERYEVSYCIDGEWRPVMKVPLQAGVQLVNRLRVMASLDRTSRARGEGTLGVTLDGAAVAFSLRLEPADPGREHAVLRRHLPPPGAAV